MKTIKERLEWILEQEEMFVPSQIGDEIQEIIDDIPDSGDIVDHCRTIVKGFDLDDKFENDSDTRHEAEMSGVRSSYAILNACQDRPVLAVQHKKSLQKLYDALSESDFGTEDDLLALNAVISGDSESWKETHFEVVSAIVQNPQSERVSHISETQGTGGLYELASDLTNQFEALNAGRKWDGDFFDEIEAFLEKELNASVPKRKSVYIQLTDDNEVPSGIIRTTNPSEVEAQWDSWLRNAESDDIDGFISWYNSEFIDHIKRIHIKTY